jgi:hypothetical protein
MSRARGDATRSGRTRSVGWIAVAAVVLACALAAAAEAQPIEEPKTYPEPLSMSPCRTSRG